MKKMWCVYAMEKPPKRTKQGIPWWSRGYDSALSLPRVPGSIPGQGTKIPHATQPNKQTNKQKNEIVPLATMNLANIQIQIRHQHPFKRMLNFRLKLSYCIVKDTKLFRMQLLSGEVVTVMERVTQGMHYISSRTGRCLLGQRHFLPDLQNRRP